MISDVFIGVRDFDRALAFYRRLMPVLGIAERFCDPSRPRADWQSQPGPRPEHQPNDHGACFREPEGNKRCVVCHAPDEAAGNGPFPACLSAGS